MTRLAIPALLIGLALVAVLLAANDVGAVLAVLHAAGWAVAIPVMLHLPQIVLSALGWRILGDPPPVPWRSVELRWVKEAVNALLPFAQVGGDVVRARLAVHGGGGDARTATAAGLIDIAIEPVAQIGFTVVGIGLLLAGPHRSGAVRVALAISAASLVVAALLLAARRFGLARLIERVSRNRAFLGDLDGLPETMTRLARRRRAMLASLGWHTLSWLAGGAEMYGALAILGLAPSVCEAIAIEALIQAVRVAGFLIPGALGVQEGGYLLVAGLFGIAAPHALALSLVRRVRDLAIGGSGLLLWHRLERGGDGG